MAELFEEFDPNQHEDAHSFDTLPAGQYEVYVSKSDVKQTKAGNGLYVWLEMTVTSGPFERRKLFAQLNIKNPNETAQKIGNGQLKALCQAVGVERCRDTAELHDIPFIAKVKVKRDQLYGDKNEIAGFEKLGAQKGQPTTKPAAHGGTGKPIAQPAAGAPPWKRG